MEKKKIGFLELYELCNKEQLFTCGSNTQYEKMFELVSLTPANGGITLNELTAILYLCSDKTLGEIREIITPLFKEEQHE